MQRLIRLTVPLATLLALVASCGHHEDSRSQNGSAAIAGSASPSGRHPTGAHPTAFVDVTVVPMDGEHELAHQTVVVDRGAITALGPVASVAIPPNAETIAGAGRWLVPGLVDMHVHFNDDNDGALFVANGVTTVRNMWGFPRNLEQRRRARADDPSYVGPWVYTAGPIVDGEPPVWQGARVVHDAKEAEAEVAAEKAAGYDFIKVYDNLSLPAYDALAAAAKRAGIRFAGHLPKAVTLAHAIEMGQASIEHLTGYLGAAQDATSNAATLSGNAARTEVAAHLDDGKLPVLAKQAADARLANCPTLIVLDRFAQLEHPEALRAQVENKYVSPLLVASWDPKQDFRAKALGPAGFEALRKGNVFRKKLVKALADAGAPLLAGTDTGNPFVIPGFSLHEELQLLVSAGLTPYQALAAATANAADWLGDKSIGRIAVGGRADLVLLTADPLKDIAATAQRAGVMIRGHWHPQDELQASLDKLAAQYATQKNPLALFDAAPALDSLLGSGAGSGAGSGSGAVIASGTYIMTLKGTPFGAERFELVQAAGGGRTLVSESVGFSPLPPLATMRADLDAKGEPVAIAVTEGAKHAAMTRAGDKVHVVAAAGERDEPLPAGALLDSSQLSSLLVFLAHAPAGQKTQLAGKALDADGSVDDTSYAIDRTATPVALSIKNKQGTAPGTAELDAAGVPTTVTFTLPFGTLAFQRQ